MMPTNKATKMYKRLGEEEVDTDMSYDCGGRGIGGCSTLLAVAAAPRRSRKPSSYNSRNSVKFL